MKLNLYDFDGTIYDGDSGIDLVLFAIKKKPILIFKILGSLGTVILYLLKLRTKEQMKSRIFSFLSEFSDTDEFITEFWATHEHKIKAFWKEKKNHKNDIIISASGRLWLEPIAKKYQVKDLFASEIDPKTGNLSAKNCHSQEKVRLFKEKYPDAIIKTMFTDSINDLPLIELAETGYLVKKDKIYKYYDYKPDIFVRFWRFGWGIYHKNEELWNYLIVGGLTTVVSLGIKWGLLFTVLDSESAIELQIAIIISWIGAVLFAYVANRLFVFKSKEKNIIKEISSFFSARLLTLGMEMLIMWFFVNLLGLDSNMWVVIITIITQILIIIFNYIFSKLFVFKKKK